MEESKVSDGTQPVASPLHPLHTFMAQVSSEMASEYSRIYARAKEDPGTAGDEGEENWATLLRDWLPGNYHVATKGRLISSDGRMSPQIDVLILKPFYPAKLREKKIWLADGVVAAFECKNTLRSNHLRDARARCASFKALVKPQTGSPRTDLRSKLLYGILSHSHAWKAPDSTPIANVEAILADTNAETKHPNQEIDLLCIADVATWTSMFMAYYQSTWLPEDCREAFHLLYGGDWSAVTTFACSALNGERQEATFQPIGAMLSYLIQRMAWEDVPLRDLADYYRMAQLWGSGQGGMRMWPQNVYSEEVRRAIPIRGLSNGLLWDDWSVGGL